MSSLRRRLGKAAEAAEQTPPVVTPILDNRRMEGDTASGAGQPIERGLLTELMASPPPHSSPSQPRTHSTSSSSGSSESGLTASPYTTQKEQRGSIGSGGVTTTIVVPPGHLSSTVADTSPPLAPTLEGRNSVPSNQSTRGSSTMERSFGADPSTPSLPPRHMRQSTQIPSTFEEDTKFDGGASGDSPVALLSGSNTDNDDNDAEGLDCLLQLSPQRNHQSMDVGGGPLHAESAMVAANVAKTYQRYKRFQTMNWEATTVVWDFLDTFDKIKRELIRMDQEESSEDDNSYSSLTSSTDGQAFDKAVRRQKATKQVPKRETRAGGSIVTVFDRVTGRESGGASASTPNHNHQQHHHQTRPSQRPSNTSAGPALYSLSSSSGRGGQRGSGAIPSPVRQSTNNGATTPSSSTPTASNDATPIWTLPKPSPTADSGAATSPTNNRSAMLARTMLASIESLRMNMEPYKPLRALAFRGMELRREMDELHQNVPSASNSMTSSVTSMKRTSIGRLQRHSNQEVRDMLHRLVRLNVGQPGVPVEGEADEQIDENDDDMWSANQYDDLELMRAASAFGNEHRNSVSFTRRFGGGTNHVKGTGGVNQGMDGMGDLALSVIMHAHPSGTMEPGAGSNAGGHNRSVSFSAPPREVSHRFSGSLDNTINKNSTSTNRSFSKLTFLGEQALNNHTSAGDGEVPYLLTKGKPRRPTSAETTMSIVSATTALPVRHNNKLTEEDDEALGIMYNGRLNVLQPLGKGAQGEVKLIQDLLEVDPNTSEPLLLAMKIVKRKMFSTLAHTREIAVMKQLRHKNIIRLREVIQDPSVKEVYLLMDYASRGPVAHLRQPNTNRKSIAKQRNDEDSSASMSSSSSVSDSANSSSSSESEGSFLSPTNPRRGNFTIPPIPSSQGSPTTPLPLRGFNKESELWCASLKPSAVLEVANQVIRALRYLHKKQIAHRDIKPDNVLVHGDGRICLADFGVSEMLDAADVSDGDENDREEFSSGHMTSSTTTMHSRISNDTAKGTEHITTAGRVPSTKSPLGLDTEDGKDDDGGFSHHRPNLQIPGTRHFHAPELLGFKPASLTLLKYNGTAARASTPNARPNSRGKEGNSSVVFCYGDIWSVGVMLHFLLFGRPPFDGSNATSLQNSILHDSPMYPENAAELLQYYERYGRLPAETKRQHRLRLRKEFGSQALDTSNFMSTSDLTSSSSKSLNNYPDSSPLKFGLPRTNTVTGAVPATPFGADDVTTPFSTTTTTSSSARKEDFKEVADWVLWKEVLDGLLTKDPTKRMTLADVRNTRLFALANGGKASERRESSVAKGVLEDAVHKKRVGKGFADFKKPAPLIPVEAKLPSILSPTAPLLSSSGSLHPALRRDQSLSGSAFLEEHEEDIPEDNSDTVSEEEAGCTEKSGEVSGEIRVTDNEIVRAIKIVRRGSGHLQQSAENPLQHQHSPVGDNCSTVASTSSPDTTKRRSLRAKIESDVAQSVSLSDTMNSQRIPPKAAKEDKQHTKGTKSRSKSEETPEERLERKRAKKEKKKTGASSSSHSRHRSIEGTMSPPPPPLSEPFGSQPLSRGDSVYTLKGKSKGQTVRGGGPSFAVGNGEVAEQSPPGRPLPSLGSLRVKPLSPKMVSSQGTGGLEDPFYSSIVSESPFAQSLSLHGTSSTAPALFQQVSRLPPATNNDPQNHHPTPQQQLFSRLRPGSEASGPSVYGRPGGGLLGSAQSSAALKTPNPVVSKALGSRSQSSLHARARSEAPILLASTVVGQPTMGGAEKPFATPPGTRVLRPARTLVTDSPPLNNSSSLNARRQVTGITSLSDLNSSNGSNNHSSSLSPSGSAPPPLGAFSRPLVHPTPTHHTQQPVPVPNGPGNGSSQHRVGSAGRSRRSLPSLLDSSGREEAVPTSVVPHPLSATPPAGTSPSCGQLLPQPIKITPNSAQLSTSSGDSHCSGVSGDSPSVHPPPTPPKGSPTQTHFGRTSSGLRASR